MYLTTRKFNIFFSKQLFSFLWKATVFSLGLFVKHIKLKIRLNYNCGDFYTSSQKRNSPMKKKNPIIRLLLSVLTLCLALPANTKVYANEYCNSDTRVKECAYLNEEKSDSATEVGSRFFELIFGKKDKNKKDIYLLEVEKC